MPHKKLFKKYRQLPQPEKNGHIRRGRHRGLPLQAGGFLKQPLNLIERFWGFAKEKLVKNTYYKKYKIFRAKAFQFLNHIDEYFEELKTLMVEKLQILHA